MVVLSAPGMTPDTIRISELQNCRRNPRWPRRRSDALFLALLEISQIRRCLPLLGGHQIPVSAQHVGFVADAHELLTLGADIFDPDPLRSRIATVGLHHGPGTRQRLVRHRDVVMDDAW